MFLSLPILLPRLKEERFSGSSKKRRIKEKRAGSRTGRTGSMEGRQDKARQGKAMKFVNINPHASLSVGTESCNPKSQFLLLSKQKMYSPCVPSSWQNQRWTGHIFSLLQVPVSAYSAICSKYFETLLLLKTWSLGSLHFHEMRPWTFFVKWLRNFTSKALISRICSWSCLNICWSKVFQPLL